MSLTILREMDLQTQIWQVIQRLDVIWFYVKKDIWYENNYCSCTGTASRKPEVLYVDHHVLNM